MKYFITDPCYIMGDDYDKLGEKMKWEMERAKFPYKCKNGVIVHRILPTPSGDGSYENIGVDSGQLCLAQVPDEIIKEQKGGKVVSSDMWENTRELYFILSKF